MFGLPLEVITMLLSTVGSAYFRLKADSNADLANERDHRRKNIESARAINTPHAAWMRRFIVIAFIGMSYIILLAPIFNLPTVVPIEVDNVFRLFFFDFGEKYTKYVTLEGMIVPEYLPHAILAIVGFYFGSSIVKR